MYESRFIISLKIVAIALFNTLKEKIRLKYLEDEIVNYCHGYLQVLVVLQYMFALYIVPQDIFSHTSVTSTLITMLSPSNPHCYNTVC